MCSIISYPEHLDIHWISLIFNQFTASSWSWIYHHHLSIVLCCLRLKWGDVNRYLIPIFFIRFISVFLDHQILVNRLSWIISWDMIFINLLITTIFFLFLPFKILAHIIVIFSWKNYFSGLLFIAVIKVSLYWSKAHLPVINIDSIFGNLHILFE